MRLAIDQHEEAARLLLKSMQKDIGKDLVKSILEQDQTDMRAIKGLLQLADSQLATNGSPEVAKKMYEFLLYNCGASSLGEYMQKGLEESVRRMGLNKAA